MRIALPNSAHLANIGGLLRGVDASDPGLLEVAIHDRWVSVHPFALALTAAMGARCREEGGEILVNIPAHRSVWYLERMGLFSVLGVESGIDLTRHESSGRFIPITQLQSAADLREAITDLVPLLHAPPQVADPIRYLFSELGRNVLEHSASPFGAFVCAQYYKKSNRIAIGIADGGIGIHGSMSRYHYVKTDGDAIRLALQPGISGATHKIGGNEFNAGAGLFFTKSIASLSRNHFVVYSGGSYFKLLKTLEGEELFLHADPATDRHRLEAVPSWPGTVIGIDVSVEQETEFAELLDEIRRAYFLDVKEKKKKFFKKIRFE